LPSPTETPRRVPLVLNAVGVHFHFVCPVLPSMAMTPPFGVSM
jgi:hypothetical protein